MIGLVLVTHGRLAQEFIVAMEHVVGPQERVLGVCIDADDDMEARREDIAAAIAEVDQGDGVIILTDLFGGTPSNLAISLMKSERIEVIAGINLPMLIRLEGARKTMEVRAAVAAARDAGRKYISVASEVLGETSRLSRLIRLVSPSTSDATEYIYARPSRAAATAGADLHRLARPFQPDQHRQIDSGDHLDPLRLHQGNGQVGGCAAEQVGQDDDAVALVDLGDRRGNVFAPRLHVVVCVDADAKDPLLRPYDMLHGHDELLREPSMRHQHQTDHLLTLDQLADRAPCRLPGTSLDVVTRGEGEVTMFDRGRKTGLAQPCGNTVGNVHRTVAPAGAAEGDCHIGFSLRAVAGEEGEQQILDFAQRRIIGFVARDIVANSAVQPGQRAQILLPVRIAKKAHVEHQIGIARHAPGETEGKHAQRRCVLAGAEPRPDLLAKRVGIAVGGVDHMIRPPPKRGHQLALSGDAIRGGAVGGKRMPPPSLGIAAHQFGACAIQVQRLDRIIMALGQRLDLLDDLARIKAPGAAVQRDCERPLVGAPTGRRRPQQMAEQRQRQVLNHLPA
jgi:PTS system mannose-specific IIA component